MIQVQKEKDKVILSITTQLDREDIQQLVSDLNEWLDTNKAKDEAFQQAQSKRKLEEEMRRCFVDLLDSEYIKKHLEVYEYNPKTKEVDIKVKKLKDGK